MARPRHPKKDLEQALREAEEAGWRVELKGRYFKLKCSCPEKHIKTMHLSPSDPNYLTNFRAWLRRQPCWPSS
jgi:hypothetical protein